MKLSDGFRFQFGSSLFVYFTDNMLVSTRFQCDLLDFSNSHNNFKFFFAGLKNKLNMWTNKGKTKNSIILSVSTEYVSILFLLILRDFIAFSITIGDNEAKRKGSWDGMPESSEAKLYPVVTADVESFIFFCHSWKGSLNIWTISSSSL